ncbi:serine--tRNA ligase [Desulfurococcaceae archaeon AG1]|jgi:seryl-tRNA synthetase|nr:MAG: serine--tRNA ligase [Desulfurococcaceae archaeon]GAY26509.1 serine--tRNA ligase [Desulfurococcaceae archaeon AG1]
MSWSVLELLRKDPEALKEHVRKRLMDVSIVDKAREIDTAWRKFQTEINEVRHRHNVISEKIAKASPEERQRLVEEAKRLLGQLQDMEKRMKELDELWEKTIRSLPNIVHESVPVGDESASKPIRVWGKARVYKEHLDQFLEETAKKGVEMDYEVIEWKPIGHADMLENVLGLGDTEKASEVAGSRFYYLFDDIVWLDMALLWYAVDFLTQKGYTLVIPPYMLRGFVITSVIDYEGLKDAIYKIEGEDLYLIGTAEHSLAALHMGEEIDEDLLPLKYVGISPSFRKEAGAGNRDLKGIFRVHQFHKVEQFVFSLPEQSWEIHEELIRNAEELFKGLGLPFRVVNIASGDLGAPAAKKYDLEVWMPAQGRFREMVSASNDLDWQSYRLKIRFVRRKGRVKGYVHTLNSTGIASTRTITAILENNQDPEGVVEIPKILRKYLEPFAKAPKDYIYPRKKSASAKSF